MKIAALPLVARNDSQIKHLIFYRQFWEKSPIEPLPHNHHLLAQCYYGEREIDCMLDSKQSENISDCAIYFMLPLRMMVE